MRINHIHLAKTALQVQIRVVVTAACRERLQGLCELDARIGQQTGEQCGPIRAVGNLQYRAFHVQGLDRPFADLAQTKVLFQSVHARARCRGRTVRDDAVVASRSAAGGRHKGGRIVVNGRDNETFGGLVRRVSQGFGFDPHRRLTAAAQPCDHENCRPSAHGGSPAARGSTRVLSAKRTDACWRSSDSETVTGRFEVAAKE
jgi:hypothetical protein